MDRDNPFEEIEELLETLGTEFDPTSGLGGSISVDVRDREDAFVVTADLPGFEKDDIEVTIADRTLRIEAEREERTSEEGEYIRRERRREAASRSISLPEAVDEEAIEATYSNGVLTVTLPKHDPDGGTRIEVE